MKIEKNYQRELLNKLGALALMMIDEPNEEIINEALLTDGRAIQFIENPTDEQIEIAAEGCLDGEFLKYVPWRDLQCQRDVVANNGLMIMYVKDPDLDLQLAAIDDYPLCYEFIEHPYEEVTKKAVTMDGFNIQFVHNQTEELQMIAVRENPNSIQYIKEPCEIAINFVIDHDPKAIFELELTEKMRGDIQKAITQKILSEKYLETTTGRKALALKKRYNQLLYRTKIDGNFVEVSTVSQDETSNEYYACVGCIDREKDWKDVEFIDKYSGRNDCNGRHVFENDIVEVTVEKGLSDVEKSETKYIVRFLPEKLSYALLDENYEVFKMLYEVQNIRVIGNIH